MCDRSVHNNTIIRFWEAKLLIYPALPQSIVNINFSFKAKSWVIGGVVWLCPRIFYWSTVYYTSFEAGWASWSDACVVNGYPKGQGWTGLPDLDFLLHFPPREYFLGLCNKSFIILCKVLAFWLQDCEEVFRFYETEYGKMLERWEKVIWINK